MATTNGIYYSQTSGLTISTNAKKRVIVSTGGTSTFTGDTYGGKVIDAVATEGQLFSVSDDLTGDILVVTNQAGGTIFAVNEYDPVRISGVTSALTASNYLVIDAGGVIKYKTQIIGESGISGISGLDAVGTSGTSGRSGLSGLSGISGQVGPTGGGLTWTYITTTQSGIVNYGFISTATTLSTITLPSTAALGSTIEVTGIGTGGWKVAQNSGQTIHFGVVNSTTGTAGYLQSTQTYDSIRLLCTTVNTDYTVLTVMGNITVI